MHFFGHRGNRYRRIVRQARHLQCASRLFGQSRLWRSGRRSGSTQIHLLCGQRRRLHTCRHHRSDIRDASGMAYRRKRALFAMPCGCDRRLQSATRRDLVIEACVRIISSCGDQSLGETPGPIPNPEAKAWHGDGTALERVWESSAPPHSHVGVPVERNAPGTPIFVFLPDFSGPSRTSRQRLSGSSKVFFRGLRPSRSSGSPGRASMTPRSVLLLSGAYRRTRGAGDPFSLMTVRIGWLDAARSWMPRYFRMLSKTSSTLSRYSFLPM